MAVKESTNFGKMVGVLSEKNLSIVKGDKGNIVRGSISVKTDNGTFELKVYTTSNKKDGGENPMYKGFETVARDYVSEQDVNVGYKSYRSGDAKTEFKSLSLIKDNLSEGAKADYVECTFNVSLNDYVGQDGLVKSTPQFRLNRVNRIGDDVESSSDLNLGCFIKSMKEEVFNDNETGRLLVDVVTIGYNETPAPLKLIVEKDLADDFQNVAETFSTAELIVEVAQNRVGEAKPKQSMFGRSSKASNGFTVTELRIVGASKFIEHGDDDAYDKKEIKKLIEARDVMLEAKAQEGNKKSTPKQSNPFEKKAPKEELELDVDMVDEDIW